MAVQKLCGDGVFNIAVMWEYLDIVFSQFQMPTSFLEGTDDQQEFLDIYLIVVLRFNGAAQGDT